MRGGQVPLDLDLLVAKSRSSSVQTIESPTRRSDGRDQELYKGLTKRIVDQLFPLLVAAVAALVLLSFATRDFPTLYSRFDLDSEATIPAWYSSALLFCVSLCAAALYLIRRESVPRPIIRLFWLVFAVAYLYMSIDETARIHEALEERLRVKWIYLYAPFATIFLIYCASYLTRIETNPKVRRWILGGVLVYGLGALGAEALLYFFYSPSVEPLEVVIEESLEMIGTSMVLVGCLHGIAATLRPDAAVARQKEASSGLNVS